eukprot:TRINITY_DN111437_c0_g1_i1.p1 TRINITY_DN111437_c0_g1~~TRINITY_DN111437_c0_g1_i1.p1  ORF type:complete len:526 (+),score=147.26 TRINITY_DN111437_c0_g1_i1:124-1701(+)
MLAVPTRPPRSWSCDGLSAVVRDGLQADVSVDRGGEHVVHVQEGTETLSPGLRSRARPLSNLDPVSHLDLDAARGESALQTSPVAAGGSASLDAPGLQQTASASNLLAQVAAAVARGMSGNSLAALVPSDSSSAPSPPSPKSPLEEPPVAPGLAPVKLPPLARLPGRVSSGASLDTVIETVDGLEAAPVSPMSSPTQGQAPAPPGVTGGGVCRRRRLESPEPRSLPLGSGFGSAAPSRQRSAEAEKSGSDEQSELSALAKTLASMTMRAPERVARKLIERLQQAAIEEACVGRSSFVWDASLPGGHSFSNIVARSFANQLKDLGFERVEWWSGKEWKDMPGKYIMIHDAMYDKYQLRIRVRWPEAVDAPQHEGSVNSGGSEASRRPLAPPGMQEVPESALASLLQQLRQMVTVQQQLLLQSAAAQASAEERAARAEGRALAAERRCLEEIARYRGLAASAAAAGDEAAASGFPGEQACEQLPQVSEAGKYLSRSEASADSLASGIAETVASDSLQDVPWEDLCGR